MKKDFSFASCFGWIMFALIVLVGGSIMNGWVLSIMWGWFVIPIFKVSALTIPYAIGISMVVSLFKTTNLNNEKKSMGDAERVAYVFGSVFLGPLFVLFLGWIVTLFI